MTTKLFPVILFAGAMLSGAEVAYDKAAAWGGNIVQTGENFLFVKGRYFLNGKDFLKIEPGKTYELCGTFRAAENSVPNHIYFGLMQFDKNHRLITDVQVNAFRDTDTELAAPCIPADTMIQVKDASKWKVGFFVQFKTSLDRSDLPNRNVSPAQCTKIEKKKDFWEVSFAKPINQNLPKNTSIRQSVPGGYYYLGGYGLTTHEWKTFSGKTKKLWPGTVYVKMLLMANWNASSAKYSTLEFKDVLFKQLP